ncbi:MAG: rod shape-determining protein MreC [Cyclobacteriaceae bacterium]|nr:rod shape-determining protein MreC [Cyclobacteriaceae bacterium]
MRQLFELIYSYRAFITFVIFEVICLWLIIGNSRMHNAAFFNTSNRLVASTFKVKNEVYQYFSLTSANRDLARENAFLREIIEKEQKQLQLAELEIFNLDTLSINPLDTTLQYEYIPARVINNSFRFTNNYITVDKGRSAGIEPEMGVISSGGIVGQVKMVSGKYSTIFSLLHSEMFVSSMIERLGVFCTAKWQGNNPALANLLYVPRHVNVQEGDRIVTSGYNSIFPPGIPVGVVENVEIEGNETFYNIEIRLANDFSRISYVYLISNKHKLEKDSLESINE